MRGAAQACGAHAGGEQGGHAKPAGEADLSDKDAAEKATAEWRVKLAAIDKNPHWARWRELASMRSLIHALHSVLLDTPGDLLQEFDQFDEKALEQEAKRLMQHLTARPELAAAPSDTEALLQAAKVLRTLDMLLEEGTETILDEAPECWLDAQGEVYFVPIPRGVMQEGGAKTGQIFGRRGILRHRIIPRAVKGTEIRITPHPDVTPADAPTQRTVGAALFTGFALDFEETAGKRFVVTKVDCAEGIEGAITRQCAAARANGCDTVIWPELTIRPEQVAQISHGLAVEPLVTSLPPIIVAGSWHVEREDGFHNLAPVFDGRGDLLLQFGKNRRFTFGGLTEDTVVHGAVHLIATDRDLVGFAICKDFCDKAVAVPIKQLDVDIVIVPSMGAATTMTAHRDAADDMKIHYGTRTAVVQQAYPLREEDPPGFVLRMPYEPRGKELADLAERLEFTTFQRETKDPRSSRGQA